MISLEKNSNNVYGCPVVSVSSLFQVNILHTKIKVHEYYVHARWIVSETL